MDCQLPLQMCGATETEVIEYLASQAVDVQDRSWDVDVILQWRFTQGKGGNQGKRVIGEEGESEYLVRWTPTWLFISDAGHAENVYSYNPEVSSLIE